jgi:hypothetical protein
MVLHFAESSGVTVSGRSEARAEFTCFRSAMGALVRRTMEVNVRHFETVGLAELSKLVPTVATLVEEACVLVSNIVEECMRETSEDVRTRRESSLPFDLAVDAAVELGGRSTSAVEDIAFMVMLEMRQRRERIRLVESSNDEVVLLGECDSALRRIRKGLGAIDVVIARLEGTVPLLDFSSELEQSLLVRRAYGKFRARVAKNGQPGPSELRSRLRAAGTHIAVLVGWSAFPLLRVRDRLQLRRLQRRILDWLRSGDVDEVAGLRLWQDVAGFVDMLGQVNRRQELLEHDATLVASLAGRLRSTSCRDDDLAAMVLVLRGMDDELDAWLEAPRIDALGPILERLELQLGAPSQGHS